MRPESLKPAHILAATKPHGTRIRYMGGCRCLPCRAANNRYARARAEKCRQGLSNKLVPANRAKTHLLRLSKKSIGRRTVAIETGIPYSSLQKIKNNIKIQIREDTERRILTVNFNNARGKALIDAAPTWKLISKLFLEGFTPDSLYKRLGYKTRIQFNKVSITARNAAKVRSLYNLVVNSIGVEKELSVYSTSSNS